MCPVCITTAMLIAGSVTSTGGLTAIAIRKFGVKNAVSNDPAPIPAQPPSSVVFPLGSASGKGLVTWRRVQWPRG